MLPRSKAESYDGSLRFAVGCMDQEMRMPTAPVSCSACIAPGAQSMVYLSDFSLKCNMQGVPLHVCAGQCRRGIMAYLAPLAGRPSCARSPRPARSCSPAPHRKPSAPNAASL